MADEILFNKYELRQTIENHRNGLRTAFDNMPDERLLNTVLAELQQYAVEKWQLELPVLGEPVIDAGRSKIEVGRYGGPPQRGEPTVRVDAERYTLEIPFTGDGDLLFHRGSSFNLNPPRGTVRGNTLSMTVLERNPNPDALNQKFERYISEVQEYLGWLSGDVQAWNQSIASEAATVIDHRRKRAEQAGSVVSGLKFNVKPRDDQATTYAVPVAARRKIVPQLPTPKPGAKPEPVLGPDVYRTILDTLNQMSLVMERSPHAYATMDEETLRFQFLVPLNANFEGEARGEVFNYGGKTDILITVGGKNIFIAECKFWRGPKSLLDTIDQILGYLSWRDTKCAILVFNRNKAFSQVLAQLRDTVEAHTHFISFDGARGETELAFSFKRPDDPDRKLTLTVLAFDIPAEDAV